MSSESQARRILAFLPALIQSAIKGDEGICHKREIEQ